MRAQLSKLKKGWLPIVNEYIKEKIMVKGLTKKDLINWGISVEEKNGEYLITRTGRPSGFHKKEVTRPVKVFDFSCKHKYGEDRVYKGIAISVNSKPKVILLSRLYYVWFIQDIPDGYDVDHIDNNPFNNNLENLQLLTRAENLAKRGVGRNQHTVNKTDKEIMARRNLITKKKELNAKIAEMTKSIQELRDEWRVELSQNHVLEARKLKEQASTLEGQLRPLKMEKKNLIKEIRGK